MPNQYQGFGTIYDFPFYELDIRTRKFTQSISRGSPRQVTFEGRVTHTELRQVLEGLDSNKIAECLASLGCAGELSGANTDLIDDGGTPTLTVTFSDGIKYKTEDQDEALHALYQLIKLYGLDSDELHEKFPW